MSLKIEIELSATRELLALTDALEMFLECSGEQYKDECSHARAADDATPYTELLSRWEKLEGARALYKRVSGSSYYKAFDKPTLPTAVR